MDFEFNHQLMPQNVLEVAEVGEFAVEAWNDQGYYWYLVVRTIMGTSIISVCGPVFPDIKLLPSGFNMSLEKIPYKEEKLARTINMFLNDHRKGITEARVIDVLDGISQFRELKEYLTTLSEETF